MDENGYPTDEELKRVEQWDIVDDTYEKLYALLDYVGNLWFYPDRVYLGKIRKHRFMKDKRIRTLYLSTGGWSGNESVIGALERNPIFWSLFWFKSQRGGHYWFEIPAKVRSNING